MALSNVIPEVWRKTVLAALRESLVFRSVANLNFKQEVWGMGDTLHVLSLGALADAEYDSSNITYTDPTDSTEDLLIDKAQYVAWKVEDNVKAKTNVAFESELLLDAGHQLADYWDALGMAEYANASLDSYSTGTTDWQFTNATAANIPAFYAAIRRQLKNAKAPMGQAFVIGTPELEEATNLYFGGKLASAKADDVVTNGFAGKFFGVNLYTSLNCVTVDTTDHGLAGIEGTAIALADDVITDEGIRLEGRIATGHRMLTMGGIKTYRPAISVDVNLNSTTIATS